MNLEDLLKELRSVKGYQGSGVATFTGEILAGDVADASLNLPLIAALSNDVLRSAHEVAEKFNSTVTETAIYSTGGCVLMRCSGKHREPHLHIGCVMAKDGNAALARMTMEKITEKAATSLK